MTVLKAAKEEAALLGQLACELWPGNKPDEMAAEMAELLENQEAACFLAFEGEVPVGFAQCQLRHDYVEGTKTSPAGYLEGVYVRENFRKKGCARALLAACEQWAKKMGCTEFASDCELENEKSLAFHLKAGFEEVNRIICFTKKL